MWITSRQYNLRSCGLLQDNIAHLFLLCMYLTINTTDAMTRIPYPDVNPAMAAAEKPSSVIMGFVLGDDVVTGLAVGDGLTVDPAMVAVERPLFVIMEFVRGGDVVAGLTVGDGFSVNPAMVAVEMLLSVIMGFVRGADLAAGLAAVDGATCSNTGRKECHPRGIFMLKSCS